MKKYNVVFKAAIMVEADSEERAKMIAWSRFNVSKLVVVAVCEEEDDE